MSIHHTFKQYPNNLRKHRKNAGLRQDEVAKALGLHTTERISKWENGHSIPMGSSLLKLAMLYRISPGQLFGEMHKTIPNPSSHSANDVTSLSAEHIPVGEHEFHSQMSIPLE